MRRVRMVRLWSKPCLHGFYLKQNTTPWRRSLHLETFPFSFASKKRMILYALILFVVLLVLGLLFIPIQIYIDTDSARYFLRLKGLVRLSFEPDEKEIVRIRMRFLFLERSFYPITDSHTSRKKHGKEKKMGSGRRLGFRKVIRLLKSFKVREFAWEMDTGDYITNAKMYPAFAFMDHYWGHCNINFQDRNHLRVDLRNRPIWIIKSIV